MYRVVNRRRLLKSIGVSSLLAGGSIPTAGRAISRASSGQFHQQLYDGSNSSATPFDGPTRSMGATWSTHLGTFPSVPLVAGGYVLGLTLEGRVHHLLALDRTDGSRAWTVDLETVITSGTLAADADRIYTGFIREPTASAYALTDGQSDWETTIELPSGGFRGGPLIQDGTVFLLARSDGGIHSFDTETGDPHQSYEGRFATFGVDETHLYATVNSTRLDAHGVAVFAIEDPGDERFFATVGRPGRPTISEGTLFVGTHDRQVHAFDAESGSEQWSATVDGWAYSVVVAEDIVLARTREAVFALDRETGEQQWEIEGGRSRPLVASDVFYVGREGGVDVYDLADGTRRHSYRPGDLGDVTYLSVVDAGLFVASRDGTVQLVQEQHFTM